jgi:hypothetical protein
VVKNACHPSYRGISQSETGTRPYLKNNLKKNDRKYGSTGRMPPSKYKALSSNPVAPEKER